MHAAAFEFVEQCVRELQARGPVYEIGARNVNGSVRVLFPGVPYLGVDVRPGPGVDLVADGHVYVPPLVPQTVVCCEVLEHDPNPHALVQQAAAVLALRGLLIITTADLGRAPHSAGTGGPLPPGEHYRNVPLQLVQRAAESKGVQPLWMAATGQDVYFVGQRLAVLDDPRVE